MRLPGQMPDCARKSCDLLLRRRSHCEKHGFLWEMVHVQGRHWEGGARWPGYACPHVFHGAQIHDARHIVTDCGNATILSIVLNVRTSFSWSTKRVQKLQIKKGQKGKRSSGTNEMYLFEGHAMVNLKSILLKKEKLIWTLYVLPAKEISV